MGRGLWVGGTYSVSPANLRDIVGLCELVYVEEVLFIRKSTKQVHKTGFFLNPHLCHYVSSCLMLSYRAFSYLVSSYVVLMYRVLLCCLIPSSLVLSILVLSCLNCLACVVLSGLILFSSIWSCLVLSNLLLLYHIMSFVV